MSNGDSSSNLPHITVPDSGQSLSYTPVSGGGGSSDIPDRKREAHADKLLKEIDTVFQERERLEKQRQEHNLPGCDGDVVSVEVHDPSVITSLEDGRQKRELLAFKPPTEEDPLGVATVYLPFDEFPKFEKKIERYRDEERSDTDKPKNRKLVQNIETIRRAALHERWTDPVEEDPPESDQEDWWEVWVRSEVKDEIFRKQCQKLGLEVRARSLHFPGRRVYLVQGTQAQLGSSFDLLDSVAELRRARPVTQEFLALSSSQESESIDDLAERLEAPADESPAVCLLDTGLFAEHPLLEPATDLGAVDSAVKKWGAEDHHPRGHGTQMAGMALYGQYLAYFLESEGPLSFRHWLESVKILPRHGQNDPESYGDITKQAVSKSELNAPGRERVFSMSVTEDPSPEGKPTAWSSAIDQITSGAEEEDTPRRLFCISAGNLPMESSYSYPESNLVEPIQDPAQSWNALTIGATTERTTIEPADEFEDWEPVAPAGDMSPSNTTSFSHDREWPSKPDLVMEGGNKAKSPSFDRPDHLDSLALLTTVGPTGTKPNARLTATGETSAATAQVSRMAAQIMSEYPDYWPETVRGLLIHSARWSDAMENRFSDESESEAAKRRLRCYGYGVPSRDKALHSARNSTVLVIQDTIQPFTIPEGKYQARSNEMNLHKLPWPSDTLLRLGDTDVRMRVTLSHFVEPNPASRGPSTRYRYASHLLGFDVQTPTESEDEFRKRVNKAERAKGEESTTSSDSGEWKLGKEARGGGSIHSDVWEGSAASLASREHIAVMPKTGWWKEYKSQNRYESTTRYALIVSIETDETEVDIAGNTETIDFYSAIKKEIGVEETIET